MAAEFRKNAYGELESYDFDNDSYISIASNGESVHINGSITIIVLEQILSKMKELQSEVVK